MSRVASPFTGLRYGVVRVTREWEMARSSFYYRREIAAQPGRVLGRRGPKTAWSDAALLEKIREVIRRLSILRRGPADQTEEEEKPTLRARAGAAHGRQTIHVPECGASA
jgi:hypothetical protein